MSELPAYIESEQARTILRLANRLRQTEPGARSALFGQLLRASEGYQPANDRERMWVLLEMVNLRRQLIAGRGWDICEDD